MVEQLETEAKSTDSALESQEVRENKADEPASEQTLKQSEEKASALVEKAVDSVLKEVIDQVTDLEVLDRRYLSIF